MPAKIDDFVVAQFGYKPRVARTAEDNAVALEEESDIEENEAEKAEGDLEEKEEERGGKDEEGLSLTNA